MRLYVLVGLALALASSPASGMGPSGTFRGTYSCVPGQGITGDTSTFIVDASAATATGCPRYCRTSMS